jgi:DNA primase
MDFATEIKERVTMFDVAERYGFDVHKKHFIHCPFHSEKTPSMKLYDGKKGCYCFGCGYSADVIGFVGKYFNLDFKQTIQKLNDDFGLGLPIGQPLSKNQQLSIAKENHKRKQEKEQREKAYDKVLTAFLNAHGEVIRLERQASQYRPMSETEDLHPLFVDYLQNIDKAKENLEIAETELMKWKMQN